MELDMKTFDSAGVEIAYLDQGRGPAVLLSHGFASNSHVNWVDTGWVRTLVGAGHRVIAYDARGHGRSEKLYDEADYGAPIFAADACRLLDHLGLERVDVMGYSMGARVSAFLALEHGARVRSAVFGGMGINMVIGLPGAKAIAHALLAPKLSDVAHSTQRSFRAFAESTGSDLKALAACILSARAKITAEMVGRIAAPVLVAVGTEDVIGGPAGDLAALIPGAIALDIAGRDHMTAVGDKTFKTAVVEFFANRP